MVREAPGKGSVVFKRRDSWLSAGAFFTYLLCSGTEKATSPTAPASMSDRLTN